MKGTFEMDRSDAAYHFVQDANLKEAQNRAKSGERTFRAEFVFAVLACVCTALWLGAGSLYIALVWGGITTIQFWRAHRLWRAGKDA